MRKKQYSELKLGGFMALILLIFVITIFSIGKTGEVFSRKYTLWTSFSRIEGLVVGAPVRLAGVDIGTVTEISFPKSLEQRFILVRMSVTISVQKRIREDSRAKITTMGLLGDKYVELTIGSSSEPIIAERGTIIGIDPIDIDAIVHKGQKFLDNLVDASGTTSEILDKVNSGEGVAGAMIDPESDYMKIMGNMADATDALKRTFQKIEGGTGSFGQLINDPNLYYNMTSITSNIDSLLRLTTNSKSAFGVMMADTLFAIKFKRDVENVMANVNTITSELESGNSLMGSLLVDENRKEILDNLNTSLVSLNNTLTNIEEGKGTVGALIYDPFVYNEIKRILYDVDIILEGGKQSSLIKIFIADTWGKGKEAVEDIFTSGDYMNKMKKKKESSLEGKKLWKPTIYYEAGEQSSR